jgi:hypothetical protein
MNYIDNLTIANTINTALAAKRPMLVDGILFTEDPTSQWQTDLGLEIGLMWGPDGLRLFDLYLDSAVSDLCRKTLHQGVKVATEVLFRLNRESDPAKKIEIGLEFDKACAAVQLTIEQFALVLRKDIYHVARDNVFAQWQEVVGVWEFISPEGLKNNHTHLLGKDRYRYQSFMTVLETLGRKKPKMTFTFRPEKYDGDVLNLLKASNKVAPVFGQAHHPLFDYLMAALANERAAEQNHIEHVTAFKWAFPEAYDLPALVFSGAGNCGKSLYGEKLVPFLLTGRKGGKLSKDVLQAGSFNGEMLGKVIYFFDEVMTDCKDRIKAWTQSETIQIHCKCLSGNDLPSEKAFRQ